MNKKLIEFSHINFGYKKDNPILYDVSFSINENEHICIVGPNGCGKSTLGKLIVGLLKPQSGSIIFKDKEVNKFNINELRSCSGAIFENPDNQFIGLSVQDDIAFGLENQRVLHKDMQPKIDEIAKFVGISDILTQSVKNLSGGQKQLVAIASILVMNPKLIVFDEVTSMMDASAKNKIDKLILSLKTKKKTIVTITHNMDDAMKADRIIVMDQGRIICIDKPNKVFANPLLNTLSLDKPFIYRLADQLHVAPTNGLAKLVKEIKNEK
ncbi:MAG: ATP-binding cassette domain-containing protein [Mycoplasmoidaceae bacterium]